MFFQGRVEVNYDSMEDNLYSKGEILKSYCAVSAEC
jgi:hypothetical protein